MKTYSLILGIAAGVLLLTARLLKILHWGGGNVFNVLGLVIACIFAVAVAYQAFSYRGREKGMDQKIDEIGKYDDEEE